MHTQNFPTVAIASRKRVSMHSQTIGWIFLAIMILAGSTSPSFGKRLTESFSPLSMLFLSEVMMLAFAILSFGFVPVIKKLSRMRRSLILPLVTAGVMNGVVAAVFWFTGLERTSAVNTELFANTEMLFLIVLGTIFLGQGLRKAHWIGGSVIVLGLITVALKGFTQGLWFSSGDTFIILACFCYGVGGTIIRRYLRHIEPQLIIFVRSCSAIAFFFIISPFVPHPFIEELRRFPLELIAILIAYGFVSRFLLVFSFYEAIERLPIPTVSLLSTTVVVGATLFAHLYLGETVHWYQGLGVVLIILGATIVQWSSICKLEKQIFRFKWRCGKPPQEMLATGHSPR